MSARQAPGREDFNPRGPCGPRRAGDPDEVWRPDISILAVLADRDASSLSAFPARRISILAVLADRDQIGCKATEENGQNFNPRGPCGPRQSTLGFCMVCKPNFNPRGPCGPRQQRRTKDLPRLCTKRRIFSPHQKVFCGKDGKTNVFPPLPRAFSGANLPGSVRALGPRTRSSGSLPAGRSACSQSARSCSRISFPGSKNADYPAPDP